MKTFVLAGDATYIVPIETMVKSLLYHHQDIKIYLLHQDISDEWFNRVGAEVSKLGSELVSIRLTEEAVCSEWVTLDHISPIGFARYWISELIEEERVVYLDCDMVVHQPLDALFDLALQGKFIAAVRDANGIGFNSGMMVIDNSRWRQEKLTGQLIQRTVEAVGSNQPLTGDQEVLNAVIQDDWLELEQSYNLQVGHDIYAFYGNWSKHFENQSLPQIIHYTTGNKPWNSVVGYRYRDVWFEYCALTMEQIKQHYKRSFEIQRVYYQYYLNMFTFTDTQNLLYVDELVQALPNVAFHIATWTQMGEQLMALQKYPNVYLYPEIVGSVIDELVEYCDGYLDHHLGSPQQWIVDRFVGERKPVLAFDKTRKGDQVEMFDSQSPEAMIQAIRQLSIPLISVIVPVYNVENYLKDCISSIINQTYNHIEIILVNDGSTDKSADICLEYSKRDSRIRYFQKENGGLSDARNYGIQQAKGQYLLFVDSDDWITEDCVEVLYEVSRKYRSKLVVSTYSRYREEDQTFHRHVFDEQYSETVYPRRELLEQLPLLERYDLSFQTSWGILSHFSLFKTVQFPKGRINEDIGTNYKLYLQVPNIVYANKALYWYRERISSITTLGLSEKKMQDDMELRMERIAILALKGYDLTHYRHQQSVYFIDWYNGIKDDSLLKNTEIVRRFHENIMLLEQ